MITYRARPKTDLIVLHDTHTVPGKFDLVNWLKVEGRRQGLLSIGYHILITLQGKVLMTRPLDTQGSHTHGFNHRSIGIALEGGRRWSIEPAVIPELMPKDTTTPDQLGALRTLLALTIEPLYGKLPIKGHSELGHHRFNHPIPCPMLDMEALRSSLA